MALVSDIPAGSLEQRLAALERTGLLRFITCGSVDDGKSTLIGRLLYDSKMIFDDQLAALEADSKKFGTRGGEIDFALLVDGLAAEREQGITIDVAYRYFATDKRKFIVADTPGHEQYTRNMVTGASTADAAVILIDARNGVLTQTRRHSYLVSLVGIRSVVLAINKMDLVDFSQSVVRQDRRRLSRLRREDRPRLVPRDPDLGARRRQCLPTVGHAHPGMTGRRCSRISKRSMSPTAGRRSDFRFWVQWVNRPNLDFRGFAGTVSSGTVKRGDALRVAPSGKISRVTRIVTADGDLERGGGGSVGDADPRRRDRRRARRSSERARRRRRASATSSR